MDDATRKGVTRFLRETAGQQQSKHWWHAFNEAAEEIANPVVAVSPLVSFFMTPRLPISRVDGFIAQIIDEARETWASQEIEEARELLALSDLTLRSLYHVPRSRYSAAGEIRLR